MIVTINSGVVVTIPIHFIIMVANTFVVAIVVVVLPIVSVTIGAVGIAVIVNFIVLIIIFTIIVIVLIAATIDIIVAVITTPTMYFFIARQTGIQVGVGCPSKGKQDTTSAGMVAR